MSPRARRLATTMIAAVVPVVLSGCVASARPAATTSAATSPASTTAGSFDVSGEISLPIHVHEDEPAPTTGADCEPAHKFDDITEGAKVILKPSSGKAVWTGSLQPGRARVNTKSPELSRCVFGFSIPNVSSKGGPYRLALVDEARGTKQLTLKELRDGPTVTVN